VYEGPSAELFHRAAFQAVVAEVEVYDVCAIPIIGMRMPMQKTVTFDNGRRRKLCGREAGVPHGRSTLSHLHATRPPLFSNDFVKNPPTTWGKPGKIRKIPSKTSRSLGLARRSAINEN